MRHSTEVKIFHSPNELSIPHMMTFSLNIGLYMFSLDSFMSCLHSLLGYSTGEFQVLQLIVLAAFGIVD